MLFLSDYERWLRSPLVWSVPLTGFTQSVNAATTFIFLPKTEVACCVDVVVGMLLVFTVCSGGAGSSSDRVV